MNLTYKTGHRSDVGLVRKINEDASLAMPDSGLWVVADGMGGHSAGDVASTTVVRALGSTGLAAGLDDLTARVRDRLTQANSAIRDHAEVNQLGTIGATVVALLVAEDGARVIWSGDSRLYRLREGRLTRLTRDHTEVNQLLESGAITEAEAEVYPRRNVITRAIGVTELPDLETRDFDAAPGDIWLLCSDGLTEHLPDGDIRDLLEGADPQTACDAMVRLVLERGARDNVTLIAIAAARTPQEGAAPAQDLDEVPLEGIIGDG
ncbi:PP2C family protein-serine/threonine phosphatase [Jannaschia rubra]|uniref:PP2C-family Ser/Thr phosphatase n=1 Tax=Jannaschia rubra TaxID=282197 RepID=A0A0M6XSZ0_9RHOB|nr:protein phosphatase 2C domain-containing protein [Jannaschia rubra]CTQ33343.1 PP2C-family Ser/Thr phosphatase [Jannaschia rubra]SFF99637.1 serine/threonine protein phosphatase Stp1 [Jannaschia rubra]